MKQLIAYKEMSYFTSFLCFTCLLLFLSLLKFLESLRPSYESFVTKSACPSKELHILRYFFLKEVYHLLEGYSIGIYVHTYYSNKRIKVWPYLHNPLNYCVTLQILLHHYFLYMLVYWDGLQWLISFLSLTFPLHVSPK